MSTMSAGRMRLGSMRFLCSLLLSSALILAVGCSAPTATADAAPSPASVPAVNPPTSLIVTRADAIAAGKNILDVEGWRWLDAPRPVFVEQMTYQGAHKYLPMLSEAPDVSQELPVWLVVYQGRWRLLPYGQTQGAPAPTVYEGCEFVLLSVRDRSVIAVGDAVCPPQP